jgi:hypothetical protein
MPFSARLRLCVPKAKLLKSVKAPWNSEEQTQKANNET